MAVVRDDQTLLELSSGAGTIRQAQHPWRRRLIWIGAIVAAIVILGMLAVLIIFYLSRGMVKIERGRSGRVIVRFNALERFVHWMTASCFIVLALSGLNITFGRTVLLPLIGIGAVVLNKAKIGKNCLVGAGSLVTEGKEFPDGSMILGSPAKVVRELSAEQQAGLLGISRHYVENAQRFSKGLKKIA